ncbi:hypothetical protein CYY_004842 [Polysphondylium violaceum]|uniref:Uncharacterized protein n=1 Tax=Polysphondylium violaceum TaxID=133409 RepID=A0A8J4USP1_9MYCE|nr:hypothetical protein CYY_004842 [Polysphondylium violaceum]
MGKQNRDPTTGVLSVFDFVQSRKYYGLQIPVATIIETLSTWWTYERYQTDRYDQNGYIQGRKTGLHLNFIPKYKIQVKRDVDGGTIIQLDYWARIRKTGIVAGILSYGITAAIGVGTISYHVIEAKDFLRSFWEWFDGSFQVVKVEVLIDEEKTMAEEQYSDGNVTKNTKITNNYYNNSNKNPSSSNMSIPSGNQGINPAGAAAGVAAGGAMAASSYPGGYKTTITSTSTPAGVVFPAQYNGSTSVYSSHTTTSSGGKPLEKSTSSPSVPTSNMSQQPGGMTSSHKTSTSSTYGQPGYPGSYPAGYAQGGSYQYQQNYQSGTGAYPQGGSYQYQQGFSTGAYPQGAYGYQQQGAYGNQQGTTQSYANQRGLAQGMSSTNQYGGSNQAYSNNQYSGSANGYNRNMQQQGYNSASGYNQQSSSYGNGSQQKEFVSSLFGNNNAYGGNSANMSNGMNSNGMNNGMRNGMNNNGMNNGMSNGINSSAPHRPAPPPPSTATLQTPTNAGSSASMMNSSSIPPPSISVPVPPPPPPQVRSAVPATTPAANSSMNRNVNSQGNLNTPPAVNGKDASKGPYATGSYMNNLQDPKNNDPNNEALKHGGLGFGYTYDHLKEELKKKSENLNQTNSGSATH